MQIPFSLSLSLSCCCCCWRCCLVYLIPFVIANARCSCDCAICPLPLVLQMFRIELLISKSDVCLSVPPCQPHQSLPSTPLSTHPKGKPCKVPAAAAAAGEDGGIEYRTGLLCSQNEFHFYAQIVCLGECGGGAARGVALHNIAFCLCFTGFYDVVDVDKFINYEQLKC